MEEDPGGEGQREPLEGATLGKAHRDPKQRPFSSSPWEPAKHAA